MKLLKGTIRPGQVLEVFENGDIKASAPGLFSFSDDPAKMPPIMAWQIGSNCNSFSKPLVNDDVWIMNFEDNPRQLYWFRKDKITNNTNVALSEENVEIICNREVGGDWMTIYFSDGSGWVIGKGESIIQIRPDGSIILDTDIPNRAIDICGDGIFLGSKDGDVHPVAYGDATEKALNYLLCALKIIQQTASLNPYTMPIGTALTAFDPGWSSTSSAITEVSSSDVLTI